MPPQQWQPQPNFAGPPRGNGTGAKVAAAVVGLCGLCCLGAALTPEQPPPTPSHVEQPPMPPPAVVPPEEPAPVPMTCPDGYADEVLRQIRADACQMGRRYNQCPAWVATISGVDPVCETGHRSLVVRTIYPERSEAAAEVARTIGNRAYIAVLRDSHSRHPRVRVVAANGNVLCANFDGSAACATNLREMFGL